MKLGHYVLVLDDAQAHTIRQELRARADVEIRNGQSSEATSTTRSPSSLSTSSPL